MSDYEPDEATARADLCRFLSACYYEPAVEFTEEHLFDSMQVAAMRLDAGLADCARRLGEAFLAQDLQALLVDYTRLFMGPIDALAKPYESSWLKAPAPTEDNPPPAVLAVYHEGGFDVDPDLMELPDHVALELEFLYLLIFNRNQAIRAGNTNEASAMAALQQRFLSEHLGIWIGPFSAAVTAGAETAFYRELAAFTERFVQLQFDAPLFH